jgi:hypothetical protein
MRELDSFASLTKAKAIEVSYSSTYLKVDTTRIFKNEMNDV